MLNFSISPCSEAFSSFAVHVEIFSWTPPLRGGFYDTPDADYFVPDIFSSDFCSSLYDEGGITSVVFLQTHLAIPL